MDAIDRSSREAINEEAALWLARLDSGSADVGAFQTWRDADPAHAVAFARIAATAELVDELRGHVGVGDLERKSIMVPRRQFALCVAGIGALAVAGFAGVRLTERASASTVVGARKTVTLPDGGRLDLNTDSKASWKFDTQRRRVWLERGEIALWVPADHRPCILIAGDRFVQLDTGDLNARLRGGAIDLTMLKGNSTILPSADRPDRQGAITVKSGEAALLGRSDLRLRPVSADDVAFTSGWRKGELIFNGQTLGVAVAEYNRYLQEKIVIADADLEGVRLGGRFTTADPKEFLAALQTGFGIHISTGSDGSLVLSR